MLDVGYNDLRSTTKMVETCRRLSRLRKINIRGNPLGFDCRAALIQQLTSLEEINGSRVGLEEASAAGAAVEGFGRMWGRLSRWRLVNVIEPADEQRVRPDDFSVSLILSKGGPAWAWIPSWRDA